jgi:hypothetical protein
MAVDEWVVLLGFVYIIELWDMYAVSEHMSTLWWCIVLNQNMLVMNKSYQNNLCTFHGKTTH